MINDPKNYAKMSVPFESLAEAQETLDKFMDSVYKLRNKHHIQDVDLVCQVSVKDGKETRHALSTAHLGAVEESEAMLSYALGEVQNARREMMRKIREAGGE